MILMISKNKGKDMSRFLELLNEQLSDEEREKHLLKNTAIKFKNKDEYKLRGKMKFQGIPVHVENYQNDTRAGFDPDDVPWSQKMKFTYGYIPGKISPDDNEGLDVYLGPNQKAQHAYIVKQHKIEEVKKWPTDYCPQCKEHVWDCSCPYAFDEDKIMLGFDNKQHAKESYLKQYDNKRFMGPIAEYSMENFKKLIEKDGKVKIPLTIKK